MAIDKSKWDLKIKVSQATIDAIKAQGMKTALANAASSGDAAYVEGVKRLYTAERLTKAGVNTSSNKGAAVPGSAPSSQQPFTGVPVPGANVTLRPDYANKSTYQGAYNAAAQTSPAAVNYGGKPTTPIAAPSKATSAPYNPRTNPMGKKTVSVTVGRGASARPVSNAKNLQAKKDNSKANPMLPKYK